jgi:hypothetical protein
MLGGWALVFAPDSSGWAPAGGILLGTTGIAACLTCDRVASRLGNARVDVRQFMVTALVVSPGMAFGGGHHGGQLSAGWSSAVSGSMLGIESLAVLIWLYLTRSGTQVG